MAENLNKRNPLQNWADIQREFPYFIDGFDKKGQPIITAISKNWDIRNAVVYVALKI